jgi:hypothetical protein
MKQHLSNQSLHPFQATTFYNKPFWIHTIIIPPLVHCTNNNDLPFFIFYTFCVWLRLVASMRKGLIKHNIKSYLLKIKIIILLLLVLHPIIGSWSTQYIYMNITLGIESTQNGLQRIPNIFTFNYLYGCHESLASPTHCSFIISSVVP